MFSGGVESTYLLWKVLTKSQHPVHAHFIRFVGTEYQRDNVNWIIDSMDYRDFEFKESNYGSTYPSSNIMLDVATIGAYVCSGYSRENDVPIDNITFARGFNKKDVTEPGHNIPISSTLFHNYFVPANGDVDRLPVIDHRVTGNVTKADMISEMPKNLYDKTISCVNYTDNGPCHICTKCEEREHAEGIY